MAQVASLAQARDVSQSPDTNQPSPPPLTTQERIAAKVAYLSTACCHATAELQLQHVCRSRP